MSEEATPKIVYHGPDTMLVNWKFTNEDGIPTGDRLPEHMIEYLSEWQAQARSVREAIPTDLVFRYSIGEQVIEQTLYMRVHGSGTWSWLLYTDDVRLSFGHGTLSGHVFCQARFSSHLLCCMSPEACIIAVEVLLYDLLGALFHRQMSEIHLCVDVTGWEVSQVDPHRDFVSRVVRIRERPMLPEEEELEGGLSPAQIKGVEKRMGEQAEEGILEPLIESNHRRIATLDFGSHGSPISCQMYNKSAEVKKRKKEHFYPIWRAHGWDGTSTVWRIEFRVKRKFLHDFELEEAYSVLGRLEQLWRYMTEEWLRYVDRSVKTANISRLPTQSIWELIQSAYTDDRETQTRDLAGEYAAREAWVIQEKPLQVVKQAVGIAVADELEDRLALTEENSVLFTLPMQTTGSPLVQSWWLLWVCMALEKQAQTWMIDSMERMEDAFLGEPVDVQREMARECLTQLSDTQRTRMLDFLSPVNFEHVQGGLVRRTRHMAKLQACIAGGLGYLRSAVALMPQDELPGFLGPNCPGSRTHPDLLSSLVWFLGKALDYDSKKGRVHVEEVHKKRLAYGFVTAAQLEEERRLYGVELQKEDWQALNGALEHLKKKVKRDDESFGAA